jgi:arylsulfatase A-like enzyme
VPLIFSVPGSIHQGKSSKAFAEFVDIYPTLCDLCGLEKPDHLEGDSLVAILNNPEIKGKKAAFTQWPKVSRTNPEKVITAYSIKTERYRYIEWTRNKTGEILAKELYDHKVDPEENYNIANLHKNQELIEKLTILLDGGRGWRKINH